MYEVNKLIKLLNKNYINKRNVIIENKTKPVKQKPAFKKRSSSIYKIKFETYNTNSVQYL